jgi:hypothetical protein
MQDASWLSTEDKGGPTLSPLHLWMELPPRGTPACCHTEGVHACHKSHWVPLTVPSANPGRCPASCHNTFKHIPPPHDTAVAAAEPASQLHLSHWPGGHTHGQGVEA